MVAVHLGWSSRTQFEETWATLLGVLVTQPITMDQEEETQQEVFKPIQQFSLKHAQLQKPYLLLQVQALFT